MHIQPLFLAAFIASQVAADLSWPRFNQPVLPNKRPRLDDAPKDVGLPYSATARRHRGRAIAASSSTSLEAYFTPVTSSILLGSTVVTVYPSTTYAVTTVSDDFGATTVTVPVSTIMVTQTVTSETIIDSEYTILPTGTAFSSLPPPSLTSLYSYTFLGATGTAYSTGLSVASTNYTATVTETVTIEPVSASVSISTTALSLNGTAISPLTNTTTSTPAFATGGDSPITGSLPPALSTGLSAGVSLGTGLGSGPSYTGTAPFPLANFTTANPTGFLTGTGTGKLSPTFTPSFPASGGSAGYPSISGTSAPFNFPNATSRLAGAASASVASGYSLPGSGVVSITAPASGIPFGTTVTSCTTTASYTNITIASTVFVTETPSSSAASSAVSSGLSSVVSANATSFTYTFTHRKHTTLSISTTSSSVISTTTTSSVPTPTPTTALLCGVHGPALGVGFIATFAEQGNGPITIHECDVDCEAQPDCLSYTFYYDEDTYAPRCGLYATNVKNAVAIDENYDTLQVWYDKGCPAPAAFPPPEQPLPSEKKVEPKRALGLWARLLDIGRQGLWEAEDEA